VGIFQSFRLSASGIMEMIKFDEEASRLFGLQKVLYEKKLFL
jgi:hypothetical protein